MGVEEPTIFEKIIKTFLMSLILIFFLQLYIFEIVNLYVSEEDSIANNVCKKLKIIRYYLYFLLSALTLIEFTCIVGIFYLINFWISVAIVLAILLISALFIYIMENDILIESYDYCSAFPDEIIIKIKDKKYNIQNRIIKFIPKIIILFIFKITGSQEYILKKILLLEFNLNYFDNKLFSSELLPKNVLNKILNDWYLDLSKTYRIEIGGFTEMFMYIIIGIVLFILVCSFLFFILMSHQNRKLDSEWENALQNLEALRLLVALLLNLHENDNYSSKSRNNLISRFTYNMMLKFDTKVYLQYCIEDLDTYILEYTSGKNDYLRDIIIKHIRLMMSEDFLIKALDSIKLPEDINITETDCLNILMDNLDNDPSYFNNKKFDLEFILDYFNKNAHENPINMKE